MELSSELLLSLFESEEELVAYVFGVASFTLLFFVLLIISLILNLSQFFTLRRYIYKPDPEDKK